jgi:exosome complex RNA-binding protein Csl4
MKQNSRAKIIAVAPLMFLVVSAGCESIALRPRPAIDDRADVSRRDLDRRDLERRPEDRAEIPRSRAVDEVTGTVQKVDQNRREIQLRTTEGRMTVIKYDPATVVYNRDREMPVDELRYGDLILIKVVKNNRGEQYADLIRLAS